MDTVSVKKYPGISCTRNLWGHGSRYGTQMARKVGYVNIVGFRSYDHYTYTFYDKRGKKLGAVSLEVDHTKNGYHRNPPEPSPYFEQLLRDLNRQADAINGALKHANHEAHGALKTATKD